MAVSMLRGINFPERLFGKKKIVLQSFRDCWFESWPWFHYHEGMHASNKGEENVMMLLCKCIIQLALISQVLSYGIYYIGGMACRCQEDFPTGRMLH